MPPHGTRASCAPARNSASPPPPSPTASACSNTISAPPLFDRFYRGVRLNERGRRYHADIERILDDLHAATARRRSRS